MNVARWLGGKVVLFGSLQIIGWVIGGLLMPWTTIGMS